MELELVDVLKDVFNQVLGGLGELARVKTCDTLEEVKLLSEGHEVLFLVHLVCYLVDQFHTVGRLVLTGGQTHDSIHYSLEVNNALFIIIFSPVDGILLFIQPDCSFHHLISEVFRGVTRSTQGPEPSKAIKYSEVLLNISLVIEEFPDLLIHVLCLLKEGCPTLEVRPVHLDCLLAILPDVVSEIVAGVFVAHENLLFQHMVPVVISWVVFLLGVSLEAECLLLHTSQDGGQCHQSELVMGTPNLFDQLLLSIDIVVRNSLSSITERLILR